VILDGSKTSSENTFQTIQEFANISGLKLNNEKNTNCLDRE